MILVVVLLGMMAGLAWFLPDDKSREFPKESEHQSNIEKLTPEQN